MSMVSIGASCKTKHEHHRTQELCKKDVTPPQPFLDFVHLFALEILNLISDHVIAYLTYLMTLFFIAFNFSMCENKLLNHRNIVSLKVICRKQDVLKLVRCVCDCL